MSSEKNSNPVSGDTAAQESYIVVARRYRPQSFDDLIGQPQVTLALGNAIKQNRVGHAYLFTGARGVGKTSSARIFAKCLNCEAGPTINPCQTCDICQGVASGEDVDVLEIDGASNRGIDEIRQLRSNVNVRPSRARFKIYIIDEVHMLTTAAFNALLKTLEEPPEHVKFIFCTTDPEKIPITVLSRCQRFDFVPIESNQIKERLRGIAEAENVEADDDALALLARRAAGSVRDSQSLLEQLLSFCESRITVNDVNSLLGTADRAVISALVDCLAERDAGNALRHLTEAILGGVDPGQLAEQLLGYFRDAMAAVVGCGEDLMLHTDPPDFGSLNERAQGFGLQQILAIVQVLDETIVRMRQTIHTRTLVELAVVRICNFENLQDISDLIERLSGSEDASPKVANRSSVKPAKKPVKKNEPIVDSAKSNQSQKPPAVVRSEPEPHGVVESVIASSPRIETRAEVLSDSNVARIWSTVLSEMGDTTADLAGDFKRLELPSPNTLVVTLADSYSCAACNRPERKERLEEALKNITGGPVRLDFVSSGEVETETAKKPALTKRQRIREVERNPLVRAAIELFDAEVLELRSPKKPR